MTAPTVIRLVAGTPVWPTQFADLDDEEPSQLFTTNPNIRQLLSRSIAIVGARQASAYGRSVAHQWAQHFESAGYPVVSGAAFGIDAAAHRGALAAGGRTVAVLASGLDVPTPRAHTELMERVSTNGALLSERPLGTTPRPRDFLVRNRLVAAATWATIVVEAGIPSGALNTARWAADLGRQVFAIPGSVFSTSSVGTHQLIADGTARLAISPEQVLANAPHIPTETVDVP